MNNNNYNKILFDHAVIGLALCRMNGDLVDVNSAFAAIIGKSTEEVLTLSYWEITPEKYLAQEAMQLESLEKTGKYGPYEKEYLHVDGHLVPVCLSGQIVDIEGERYIWSSVEDITARKRVENELARLYKEVKQQSLLDGLTGVSNRRMFDLSLEREWKHSVRDGVPLSLILIDVDYFKMYNDGYGHRQGDECLKLIAQLLSTLARRPLDLISRYGGEEFVLLLPNTSKLQAIGIAEQCISIVRSRSIPHKLSKTSDIVTVSAGVCTVIPMGDTRSSSLIESADKLLYEAKTNGRNRLEY